MQYRVEFYENLASKKEAQVALDEMERHAPKLFKAMLACLIKIKDSSNHKMPITKPYEPGLFYVRAKAGQHWGRMFFTFTPGYNIWLLSGYMKSTDRLSVQEVTKARKLKEELHRRKKKK